MADTTVPRRLPRGRHTLTREEVEQDQRLRILVALAEVMGRQGYVGTPVADVIKEAGVSRETFYRLFTDKLDAFLAAFDLVSDLLIDAVVSSTQAGTGTPLEQFERAMTTYLDTMAFAPSYARLFLVEVHAAGPRAIARRHDVQRRIVDAIASLLGARNEEARFTCQVLVAAVSAMIVTPLVEEDPDALRALGPQVVAHVRRLDAAGVFSS